MGRVYRLLCAFALLAVFVAPAAARTITDSAGREVALPEKTERVFAAGPPASVLLYVLAPEKMIGWVRTPRAAEARFLREEVRGLPERGRLSGRGDTLNLERLIADRPDLVMDFGTINATYRSLADRVTAQTGIPYVLIDGRFENTPAAIRLLGAALGVSPRAEMLADEAERIFAMVDRTVARVPPEKRPRVYLARGPDGLETGTRGSITTEIVERVGAVNVADGIRDGGGLVNVSAEQVIAWAPDTIVTLDPGFHRNAGTRPEWRPVPAVAGDRVFLAPRLPYGFVDAPPSVNRLIGLVWLLHVLYPDQAEGDLEAEIVRFYRNFYGVELDRAGLDEVLGRKG